MNRLGYCGGLEPCHDSVCAKALCGMHHLVSRFDNFHQRMSLWNGLTAVRVSRVSRDFWNLISELFVLVSMAAVAVGGYAQPRLSS